MLYNFQDSLSRQESFLFISDFLWIDYIISSAFYFVNTFCDYFLLFFIILFFALNCLIFIYLF